MGAGVGRKAPVRGGRRLRAAGVLIGDSASERHGRAPHGAHAGPHGDRCHRALEAHAGLQHAVAAGHGSRRHRDTDGRRAATCEAEASTGASWGAKSSRRGFGSGRSSSGGTIKKQMLRLGASCDWSRERFTLDPGLSRAVREVFVRLYEKGLIYRGKYIVNWCPRCQTAISDLEVVHEPRRGAPVAHSLSGERHRPKRGGCDDAS